MKLIRQSVVNMHGYTPGEQPQGEQRVLKLNTNENPYPPSPAIADVLRDIDVSRLRLYPDPVAVDLRGEIAALHNCEVENVFVGNGSDEVLELCTRAFVENDGRIGYFEPSYSLYPVLADIREVEKCPVKLNDDFSWNMPSDDNSLFFVTNPNAPTSILYNRNDVIKFCEAASGVVVLDEAYVDFSDSNCMDLAFQFENVLVARTLSKSYSLAGLRLGYAVGSADLIAALYKVKDSYNLNAITQRIAVAAIRDQKNMLENVAKIKQTRAYFSKELEKDGFLVMPSQTNFIWTKPNGISADKLYQELYERRILIRYFPGDVTGEYVRITIGTDAEIAELLTAIREIIHRIKTG